MTAFPVPRDLMLPLPFPALLLKFLLVVFFLLHILFVNLMVGGVLWTVVLEWWGRRSPRYDAVAKAIASTVTVNKSLAVVLGVGPLLCISLVYTSSFYTANVLTAHAWWGLVPLVTVAFLLTYLHKYTWDSWTGPAKGRHLWVGVAAALLFGLIPFIFLSNINLMLFPERWAEVRGFLSSLKIANVFPRYFHFFAASNAAVGLFLAAWFARPGFPLETLPGWTRGELKRFFVGIAFAFTAMQFLFGPTLLLTLPWRAYTVGMWVVILTGAIFGLGLLHLLWMEMRSTEESIGRRFWSSVVVFSIVVIFMGTGRHLYREAALVPFHQAVAQKTLAFQTLERGVAMRLAAGAGAGEDPNAPPTGKSVFNQNCAACHTWGRVLVGPSIQEVAAAYQGNVDGIVAWAKAPGKKRADLPQMPSMAHLGDDKLKLVAQYVLDLGAGKETFSPPEGAASAGL